MLLNIYLGTTAISLATIFISTAACENILKRKGYKFVNENKTVPEKIIKFASTAFKGSIPFYNILNTIIILCMGDKLYDYIENKLLLNGKIYMPIESKSYNNHIFQNNNKEKINEYYEIKKEKKYSEMTIEEKLNYLQKEKENLLNQSITQIEKPYTLIKRIK